MKEKLLVWTENKQMNSQIKVISNKLAFDFQAVTFEQESFFEDYFLCFIDRNMLPPSPNAFVTRLGKHLKSKNIKCIIWGTIPIPKQFLDNILCAPGKLSEAELIDLLSASQQKSTIYKKRMAAVSYLLMKNRPETKRIFRCLYLYRELYEQKAVFISDMAEILHTTPQTTRRDIDTLKDFGCHIIITREGNKRRIVMVRGF